MISFIISFQAKSQFKRRSTANNVEIVIPVPPDADSPKFKTTVGSCKYAPEINAVIWNIKSFPVSIKVLMIFVDYGEVLALLDYLAGLLFWLTISRVIVLQCG